MPAQRKYPEELRERAVKMVFEVREREGKGRGESGFMIVRLCLFGSPCLRQTDDGYASVPAGFTCGTCGFAATIR
jgi:hypothetical protein